MLHKHILHTLSRERVMTAKQIISQTYMIVFCVNVEKDKIDKFPYWKMALVNCRSKFMAAVFYVKEWGWLRWSLKTMKAKNPRCSVAVWKWYKHRQILICYKQRRCCRFYLYDENIFIARPIMSPGTKVGTKHFGTVRIRPSFTNSNNKNYH